LTEKYIVSNDRKFIYFVVQKVACSSIKTALLPLFDASGYQIGKKKLLAGLKDKYEPYFKFAFVRNPWDRLVSCYSEKLGPNGPGMRLPEDVDVELYPGMPFAEFVEAVYMVPDHKANIHFQSQYQSICDSGSSNAIMADFVGRFENLKDDFDIVANSISDSQDLQLPHILRSKRRNFRPYTAYYDDRLKHLVHERYKEDIEIFGYAY
jgi:chondroitin 4-sulfotransferase 11